MIVPANECGKLLAVTLLTARDIREIAADIGLRPTKQKGQNFVIDPNTVRSIVASAKLQGHSSVVEIGPGLGSLTLGLLEAGHDVTAVEIDEVLAQRLPATVKKYGHTDDAAEGAANFELVNADALRVTELPTAPEALVANLPYNVAVPVLLHFLEIFPSLKSVLVMVQLEVAERLAAGPGSRTYGVPSVKAQWYGDVTSGRTHRQERVLAGPEHRLRTRPHRRDPHPAGPAAAPSPIQRRRRGLRPTSQDSPCGTGHLGRQPPAG